MISDGKSIYDTRLKNQWETWCIKALATHIHKDKDASPNGSIQIRWAWPKWFQVKFLVRRVAGSNLLMQYGSYHSYSQGYCAYEYPLKFLPDLLKLEVFDHVNYWRESGIFKWTWSTSLGSTYERNDRRIYLHLSLKWIVNMWTIQISPFTSSGNQPCKFSWPYAILMNVRD